MKTKVFDFNVIMSECESIIASTENILDLYDDIDLCDIREIAEYLQKMTIDYTDNKISFVELNDITVELYQNIKYSVDDILENYIDFEFFDLIEVNCNDMKNSINEIRSYFVDIELLNV